MIGGLKKTTSQLAIAAAASFLIGGFALSTAHAADLGGDCCADLEERVSELEMTTVRKGNKKVSLTISGSVAYALIAWDDGFEDDINVINPDTDGNGLSLDGKGSITSDLSMGYAVRLDLRRGNPFDGGEASDADFNPADGVPDRPDLGNLQYYDNDGQTISVSQQWVYLESKHLGTIEMGFRNSSYKSVNDGGADLAGVDYLSAATGRAAGIFVRDSVTGVGTGVGFYNIMGNIGSNKHPVIRYNSPSLAGFAFSASWGGDDQAAVNMSYDGKFSDTQFVFVVGYEVDTTQSLSDLDNEKFTIGASAYNSPSGLFFTGEYDIGYADEVGEEDRIAWYLKGGWRKNVTGLGDTTVYASYLRGKNQFQDAGFIGSDVEASTWTIGMKQNLDSASSALFWHYDHREILEGDVELGCPNECGDVDTFVAGMKISF